MSLDFYLLVFWYISPEFFIITYDVVILLLFLSLPFDSRNFLLYLALPLTLFIALALLSFLPLELCILPGSSISIIHLMHYSIFSTLLVCPALSPCSLLLGVGFVFELGLPLCILYPRGSHQFRSGISSSLFSLFFLSYADSITVMRNGMFMILSSSGALQGSAHT